MRWATAIDVGADRIDIHFRPTTGPPRGVDERPVRADRIRKSAGAENTFAADLFTYEAARDALREIIDKLWGYCEGSGIRGRTVTLKFKFANFQLGHCQ